MGIHGKWVIENLDSAYAAFINSTLTALQSAVNSYNQKHLKCSIIAAHLAI